MTECALDSKPHVLLQFTYLVIIHSDFIILQSWRARTCLLYCQCLERHVWYVVGNKYLSSECTNFPLVLESQEVHN